MVPCTVLVLRQLLLDGSETNTTLNDCTVDTIRRIGCSWSTALYMCYVSDDVVMSCLSCLLMPTKKVVTQIVNTAIYISTYKIGVSESSVERRQLVRLMHA
jgi:hypothetical protein